MSTIVRIPTGRFRRAVRAGVPRGHVRRILREIDSLGDVNTVRVEVPGRSVRRAMSTFGVEKVSYELRASVFVSWLYMTYPDRKWIRAVDLERVAGNVPKTAETLCTA